MHLLIKFIFLSVLTLNCFSQEFIKTLEMFETITPYDYPEFTTDKIWNHGRETKKLLHTKKVNGDVIYEYVTTFNKYGFREFNQEVPDAKYHIILGGCSFTYGEGMEDQKIFAYKLQEKLNEFKVYNFGIRGGGVLNQYFDWKVFDFKKLISKPKGVYIYTLFSDHLNRSKKSWNYLMWIAKESPYITIQENGLTIEKSMGELFSHKFVQFLVKYNLIGYWLRLTSHFEDFGKEKDIKDLVTSLKILKNTYLENFPNGRFIVSEMFPFTFILNPEHRALFLKLLDEYNIEYWENLDFEKHEELVFTASERVPGRTNNNYEIMDDGHPNEMTHGLYANFLEEKIKGLNFQDTLTSK